MSGEPHHLGHHKNYNVLFPFLSDAPAPRPSGPQMDYPLPFRSADGSYITSLQLTPDAVSTVYHLFALTPERATPAAHITTIGTGNFTAIPITTANCWIVDKVTTPDVSSVIQWSGTDPRQLIIQPPVDVSATGPRYTRSCPVPLQQFCGGRWEVEIAVPYNGACSVSSLGPNENRHWWSMARPPQGQANDAQQINNENQNRALRPIQMHFPDFEATNVSIQGMATRMHVTQVVGGGPKAVCHVSGVMAPSQVWNAVPVIPTGSVDGGTLNWMSGNPAIGNNLNIVATSRAFVIVAVPPGTQNVVSVTFKGRNVYHVTLPLGDAETDQPRSNGAQELLIASSPIAHAHETTRSLGVVGRGNNLQEATFNLVSAAVRHPDLDGVEGHVEKHMAMPLAVTLDSKLIASAAHPDDPKEATTSRVVVAKKPGFLAKIKAKAAQSAARVGENLEDKFLNSKAAQKGEKFAENLAESAFDGLSRLFHIGD